MNKIAIFYHVYQVNHWETLFDEQIVSLQLGINGEIPLPYDLIKINSTKRNLNTDGEADTLSDLYDFCKLNPDYRVLYLNMLGVTFPKDFQNKINWVTYLTYFTIHNWKRCVNLLDEYDCVGTEWTIKHPDKDVAVPPHYAGNFWWANAAYINMLDKNYLYAQTASQWKDWEGQRRHYSEFWIGTGNPKHYNFYSSNKNKYRELVIPSEYENKLE